MRVNVVCRNWRDDRVLPRFARYLAAGLGWNLTPAPAREAEAYYLMGYFESQLMPKWPRVPVASLFTHREEEPPGNAKARLYDAVAARVSLRVSMCRLYAEGLRRFGPTIQPPLPLERERFVQADRPMHARPLVGLSGYTYKNHRKGEDLAALLVKSAIGRRVDWVSSGRGWPAPLQRYTWRDMPRFYQQLDVFVCPSRVEGGPMPVLEALACGIPVVVPRGVGLLDELPDTAGIFRYGRGHFGELEAALTEAVNAFGSVDRDGLRAVTAPYTVETWCAGHRDGFEAAFVERAA